MALLAIVEASWVVFLIVWAITSLQAKTSVRRGLNSAGVLWRIAVFIIVVALGQGMARGWCRG